MKQRDGNLCCWLADGVVDNAACRTEHRLVLVFDSENSPQAWVCFVVQGGRTTNPPNTATPGQTPARPASTASGHSSGALGGQSADGGGEPLMFLCISVPEEYLHEYVTYL